jgi:mycothiol synthase
MEQQLTFKIVSGPEALEIVSRIASVGRWGSDREEARAVFLKFLARYEIDASRQAGAFLGERLIGYSLCLVNPGATASVFLPEGFPELVPGYSYFEVASQILRCLADSMAEWDLAVLQTMVVDENSLPARIFSSAGFGVLCRLNILDAGVEMETREDPTEDIEWLPFGQIPEERFSDLILQTYDASQDCPRLTGLRTGGEVLAGHRYAGIFEPDGWAILQFRRRDAGVLLLNSTEEDPGRMELIYMGLAPWARGADLSRHLMRRVFEIARRKGKKTIRLAVDGGNVPALRLYNKFGFKEVARQTVLAVLNESRKNKIKEGPHGR